MIKNIQLFGVILVLCSCHAMAGTVVELQQGNELSTAVTDGQRVRMNTSAFEYLILDSNDHSVRLVDREKQLVTLLHTGQADTTDSEAIVRTSLSPQGRGQAVAGYNTEKFNYFANGEYCGVLYGSMNAIETSGVREMLSAMKVMLDRQRAALGGFASLVDACTLADMQLVDYVSKIGLPMRTEKNGRVELEIKAIKTDVPLAKDAFVIPAGYKIVDTSGRVITAAQNTMAATNQTQPAPSRKPASHQQPREISPAIPQAQPRSATRQPRFSTPVYSRSGYPVRPYPRIPGRY